MSADNVRYQVAVGRFGERNPRKNDAAVDRMCASIREFGFKIPVLARRDGEVVDGRLFVGDAADNGVGARSPGYFAVTQCGG